MKLPCLHRLICEKGEKPLGIKGGKPGRFIACRGNPDLSCKKAEADLKKVQEEIERQRERARNKVVKLQARYPEVTIHYEQGRFVRVSQFPEKIAGVLKRAEKEFARQRIKDHKTIEARLEKLQARY